MDKRNKPMSVEQKNILIEFISLNPQLTGKFSNTFTRQDSITIWKDITNILNATPGASKEWKEWRKSWHDIRSRTKNKKAQMNVHASQTGGGPSMADLSQSDERIVSLIGDTAIRGLSGVAEPMVQVIELDDEMPEQDDTSPPHENVQEEIPLGDEIQANPAKKNHRTRNIATQRLDKAVDVGKETIELLREKTLMKKEYYEKKLLLMERNVVANENLVSEVEELKKIILEKLINK